VTFVEMPFTPDRRRKHDRRTEPRVPSPGRIDFSFDDPSPTVVEAELIESSSSGFRAVHDSKVLNPGIEVQFHRDGASGRARVIWTHVLNQRRVSGFLTL
jgi:hypothetical protein